MGLYQGNWAALELTTDYAIYQFLDVTAEQAHLITSGMMFGRKGRLLADLIGTSKHPKKAVLLGAFNKIRGVSKRDLFAHSYLRSDKNTVTFLERLSGGSFKAKEVTFTLDEFKVHALEFATACQNFYEALEVEYPKIDAFARSALKVKQAKDDESA